MLDLRRDVLPLRPLSRGDWRLHRRPFWRRGKKPWFAVGWRTGGFWALDLGPLQLCASVFTSDGRRF